VSDDPTDMGPACRGPDDPKEPIPYYGKYRGRVESNLDEELMGRIQVTCPAVMGLRLGWAMPCVPYAGPGVGFYAIPPIGADVWVEFEGGDPNYPIWSGCFWQPGEIPIPPGDPNTKCMVTTACRWVMNDLLEEGGGIAIEVNLAAAATATAEEAQSAAAAAADVGFAAADAAAGAAGGLGPEGAAAADESAEAAGDAEEAASDAEWAAMEAETADDEIAAEAGEDPGVYSIVIKMTGITIAVPLAEINMTPETITATVPESVINMTSADITITVPESVITLTPEQIIATCPPGLVAIGPEAITLSIADTNQVLSEAAIEIEAPTTSITSIVEVEGNSSFTGSVEVEGNTSLLGLLEVDGANIEMAAAAIELNAADNNVLGMMTVEGDIIMDGMQVLAI
jgi:hypothetical protein